MGTDAVPTAGGAVRLRSRCAAAASVSILLLLCATAGSAHAIGAIGSPPVNLALPSISGTAQSGQTLSCSEGTWTEMGNVYTFSWNRDGGAISGATSASYTVAAADVAHLLTCSVTATNTGGAVTATSGAVVPTAGGTGGTPTGGGGGGTPGTATPLPKAAEVVDMPGKRRCGSRRSFRIRIRKVAGISFASVAVFVNGKRVKVVAGSRLTAPVDLRGLPKGKFTAKIVVKASDGRKLSHTRKYRTCSSKRGAKRRNKL